MPDDAVDDSKWVARICDNRNGTFAAAIFCPACRCGHAFTYIGKNSRGASWTWNKDHIKPTFSPSMLVKGEKYVCHSFVREGKIEFLGDCTHELAGKTVALEPF
jgi:hypothetical protein